MSDPLASGAVTPDPAALVAQPPVVTPTPLAAPVAQPPAPIPPRVNPHALTPRPAAPIAPPVVGAPAIIEDPRILALQQRVDALVGVVGTSVAQDLAALPENVRKTVATLAGDDPVRQREVLDTMRANGMTSNVLPPGATTTSTAGAPPPAAPPVVTSDDAALLAQHEKYKTVAPSYAAQFYAANRAAIMRAAASRPS